MRRSLRCAFALPALLALSSSPTIGWSVTLHLTTDDHHSGGSPDHDGALGLEMALHGHAHAEGTPAHGHPFLGSVAAPIPGKLLLVAATIGDAPEVVLAETSARRLLSEAGRTHDPPPRVEAPSVLRI